MDTVATDDVIDTLTAERMDSKPAPHIFVIGHRPAFCQHIVWEHVEFAAPMSDCGPSTGSRRITGSLIHLGLTPLPVTDIFNTH